MTDRRSATPNSWCVWLLLSVAVWLSFAPAVVAVAPARLSQSVAEGPPLASGVHKYLYAHADPVMFSDPSGHLSRAARALIGMEVHTKIGAHFRAGDPENRYSENVTMSVILSRMDDDGDLELKPDLVDDAKMEMYEVKPEGNGRGTAKALKQVKRYISVAGKYGRSYQLGESYTPPTTVSISPIHGRVIVSIWREEPGVILYQLYEQDDEDEKVKIAVVSTAYTLAYLSRLVSVAESGRQAGIKGRLALAFYTK